MSTLSSIPLDAVLIALCGTCVIYCALLSSRLRRLSSLKRGIGASILGLTESIESTRAASRDTASDIAAAIADLERLLDAAVSESVRLEARTGDAKALSRRLGRQTGAKPPEADIAKLLQSREALGVLVRIVDSVVARRLDPDGSGVRRTSKQVEPCA